MRLPRFRIRTLSVLVAVCAVPMATIADLQRRAERFRELAAFHRQQADAFGLRDLEWFLILQTPQGGGVNWWRAYFDSDDDRELAIAAAHYCGHEWTLSLEYEAAAKRPWISPDISKTSPPAPPVARTKAVVRRALARMNSELKVAAANMDQP